MGLPLGPADGLTDYEAARSKTVFVAHGRTRPVTDDVRPSVVSLPTCRPKVRPDGLFREFTEY